MIRIENLNKYYNKRKSNQIHVIDNTNIELANSGLVALLGASGCGKTKCADLIGSVLFNQGNYVVINHGDGYATLYGHASSLLVSPGQQVTKGAPLGYVGSTGYSTGPHLHFEIMKNGDYTNPVDYFKGSITFTYS